MKVLIIGGSDAGISAALRLRELEAGVDTTVLLADSYPNFSICGLPFYVSGETPDWRALAHRTEFQGIHLLKNHTATAIEPDRHKVRALTEVGEVKELSYDRLLIATGAKPVSPPINGLNLPGVFFLHTMSDSFRLNDYLAEHRPRRAVIIGSGYIGLEMADALSHRGLQVNLVGRTEAVLPSVDLDLGRLIEEELRSHGVTVNNNVEVSVIEREGSSLVVKDPSGFWAVGEVVLVAAGVRPASELAAAAGIPTGLHGAIQVTRRMETCVSDVYAAGDCVETWHRLLRRYTYLPLGTTAHKQGRVAGENIAGGCREFAGSVGTQVVKVFDLAIARTGLREREAREGGFDPLTVESAVLDHKAYYPGARELRLRITGDRTTGQLLGGQLLGHWQGEVAKRIDILAGALFHEMKVEELNDLDLSYTPPVSSPWDAVQIGAQAWVRALSHNPRPASKKD